jgi:LAO/AO transport system ATPase
VNRPIDLARLRARDKATVARALDRADDSRPGAEEALLALFAELAREGTDGTGARVGVTGPPGVGKSTLVAAIARAYRQRDLSVGVLAIDPSSVRSGGALLGDRVRIAPDIPDPGLFVRSLATRGEAGGLARTVPAAARILGSVYERTLIETVGVGQNETDVRDVVDTVILVIQPGSGDALQFLKAGIMEVPDVLVVNKSDQDELARRAESELKMALHALESARRAGGEQVGPGRAGADPRGARPRPRRAQAAGAAPARAAPAPRGAPLPAAVRRARAAGGRRLWPLARVDRRCFRSPGRGPEPVSSPVDPRGAWRVTP